MPNQRDPRKQSFSRWLWSEDVEFLKEGAREHDMSLVDFVHKLCEEHQKQLGRKNKGKEQK